MPTGPRTSTEFFNRFIPNDFQQPPCCSPTPFRHCRPSATQRTRPSPSWCRDRDFFQTGCRARDSAAAGPPKRKTAPRLAGCRRGFRRLSRPGAARLSGQSLPRCSNRWSAPRLAGCRRGHRFPFPLSGRQARSGQRAGRARERTHAPRLAGCRRVVSLAHCKCVAYPSGQGLPRESGRWSAPRLAGCRRGHRPSQFSRSRRIPPNPRPILRAITSPYCLRK